MTGLTHGSLFSGIGGFDLGFQWAGIETLWDVEIEPYAQKVLRKNFPNTEIFDDVREVGKHNLKPVDILSGGFPCQDISVAGKQAGIDGERSGLWSEFYRIIGELQPRFVVIENVANLVSLGLGRVLADLAQIGYDAEWQIISANDVGAPHLRKRIWIVAYPPKQRLPDRRRAPMGDTGEEEQETQRQSGSRNGLQDATNSAIQDDRSSNTREVERQESKPRKGCVGNDVGNSKCIRGKAGLAGSEQGESRGPGIFVNASDQERRGAREYTWPSEPDLGCLVDGLPFGLAEQFTSRDIPRDSKVPRVATGAPERVNKLRGLGNAIIPGIAEIIGNRLVQINVGIR